MCRNKTGWKSRRDHSPVMSSPVVESRLTASPLEVARPAAPRPGRTLGERNFPNKTSGQPLTASAAAAAQSLLTGSSRLSKSTLGSRR